VAEAINQLDADRKSADFAGLEGLEARIAEVWAMVREIDPELARLASRYAEPRDLRPSGAPAEPRHCHIVVHLTTTM
jgi:hypothetical protein